MTFHVVSLPHTQTTKEFLPCAYTQKVVKFANMMHDAGHKVYVYSGDKNEARCTEHISCITEEEQEQFFGHTDWKKDFFPIEWTIDKPYWQIMNARAYIEMQKRIKPKDFICLIAGPCQVSISEQLPNNMMVEFGIGYHQTVSTYRVFESYAWMHHRYGAYGIDDGACYDAVIPNYFDPDDFVDVMPKEDYLLFVGRLVSRKGLHVVNELGLATGKRVLFMGQGGEINKKGNLVGKEKGYEVEITCKHDYLGVITNPLRKSEIMAKAQALICPTSYIGPFEGVSVEALMSGTPVICTDWGAFTENIQHGQNGYRCRVLADYIQAVENLHNLHSPQKIKANAIENFGMHRVREMYEHYFEQLLGLWDVGWPSKKPLSYPFWLEKYY